MRPYIPHSLVFAAHFFRENSAIEKVDVFFNSLEEWICHSPWWVEFASIFCRSFTFCCCSRNLEVQTIVQDNFINFDTNCGRIMQAIMSYSSILQFWPFYHFFLSVRFFFFLIAALSATVFSSYSSKRSLMHFFLTQAEGWYFFGRHRFKNTPIASCKVV